MANHTILLIDYEPRSIERFRQPLNAAGYRVEIATDGIAGVEAFTRLNPDMVLVEAMIPKKHGFEVCQELKRTPHGRRIPIIITTGVYKGRKYRTQALHIYGCDEYIEKPIAAEQLLAIVARFLSGSAPAAREHVSAVVDAGDAAGATSVETSRTSDPAPPRPSSHKPNSGPKAVVADLTEDEIMARLDAILPAGGPASVEPIIEIVTDEPEMRSEPAEPQAEVELDPFKQMQAELTAELGSLSTALALEPARHLEPVPETMPSDQAAVPPLLESLPEPELTAPSTAPDLPSPGQVVSFDAKRSRKHKKDRKRSVPIQDAGPPAAAVPSVAEPPKEIGIPSGTLVESALAEEPPSRGFPTWIWIVVGAVALIAAYFVFWREGASTTQVPAEERSVARTFDAPAEEAPATTEPDPAGLPPADSTGSRLVLNAVGPQPARSAPPPPVAPKPAPKRDAAVAAAPAGTAVKALEGKPSPALVPTEAPPSVADLGAADAGVEAIAAAVTEPAPRETTPRGALVDLADVDSAPTSLTRKLPTYSMQARQLRLQGTVVMKVLVNEQGTVDQVVVVSGIDGADLNDAALKAARQWTYRPATKDGVPVKVWTTEQVTFKI